MQIEIQAAQLLMNFTMKSHNKKSPRVTTNIRVNSKSFRLLLFLIKRVVSLTLAHIYMVGRVGQLTFYPLKTWEHFQHYSILLVDVSNNVEGVNVLKTMFPTLNFANANVFLSRSQTQRYLEASRICMTLVND